MTDLVAVALSADPPGVELTPPMSMRWPAELIARADAAALRLGLNRSAVLRLALAEGLPAVERLGR